MKRFLLGIFYLCVAISCGTVDEGFVGEWEGSQERLNSEGQPVDVTLSCTIKSLVGQKRSIDLKVGGSNYKFEAIEDADRLIYTDYPLNEDSIVIEYISGEAVILNDTILHLDHKLYAKKNGALLYSESEMLELKRSD